MSVRTEDNTEPAQVAAAIQVSRVLWQLTITLYCVPHRSPSTVGLLRTGTEHSK